jgi:hypothetical protein
LSPSHPPSSRIKRAWIACPLTTGRRRRNWRRRTGSITATDGTSFTTYRYSFVKNNTKAQSFNSILHSKACQHLLLLNAVTAQVRLTNKSHKTISRIFCIFDPGDYVQLAWRIFCRPLQKVKKEGISPKFIWAPCHVMCTAVLTGRDPATPPPPPPTFGLVYEGAIGQQR